MIVRWRKPERDGCLHSLPAVWLVHANSRETVRTMKSQSTEMETHTQRKIHKTILFSLSNSNSDPWWCGSLRFHSCFYSKLVSFSLPSWPWYWTGYKNSESIIFSAISFYVISMSWNGALSVSMSWSTVRASSGGLVPSQFSSKPTWNRLCLLISLISFP